MDKPGSPRLPRSTCYPINAAGSPPETWGGVCLIFGTLLLEARGERCLQGPCASNSFFPPGRRFLGKGELSQW